MRVSIITPSKNQGQYIDHCLRSVHGQTHRDIEHIIIDGMSTDETADVAASYPCTFVQRQDSGPAQAINRGLDLCSGDIVCWLNADDAYFSNTVLERVVGLFSEFPDLDVISGDGYYIGEYGKYLNPIVNSEPSRFNAKWIKKHDFVLQPATFWRRNPMRLDETQKYCFDWKLWIDFFNAGLSFLYVREYFALYRVQPSSLTFLDTARRSGEFYKTVKQNGSNRLHLVRLWINWRLFQLSEAWHLPGLKTMARVMSKIALLVGHGYL